MPGAIVDGPSADIVSFGDLDMAPDGTGALAYSKKVAGVQHTFVSLYSNGAWGTGAQVDTGIATATSNPRVAVGNGGRVLVTFTDAANNLYGALKPNTAGAFAITSPDPTSNTIIDYAEVDMDPASGVAYTAFHTTTGHVRASRLSGTTWTPVDSSGNLDNNATNANASGSGSMLGPRVAVDTSGNAVVVWPEGQATTDQAAYVRRITGTTSAAAVKASIDSLAGKNAGNVSDMVDLDGGGSASPWVVFREGFDYGGTLRPRDLARQFSGSTFGTAQVMDGLPLDTPTEGAEYPRIDVNGAGQGLVGMPRQLTFQTYGSALAAGVWSTGFRVDSGTPTGASFPVAAIADSGNGLVAWIDTTGGASATKVVSIQKAGGQQQTLSRDSLGQVAGVGLEAATSSAGNVGVGFAQGAAGSIAIVAAVVDLPKPPGGGPGGPGGPGGSDKTAPKISSLRISRKTFRRGSALPHMAARRPPVGTTFSFSVSELSRTTLQFQRAAGGRRVGKRCLAPTRGRAKRKRCTRYVAVRPSLVYTTAAGSHKFDFAGRLTRRTKLKPGKYRLSVTSKDNAGNTSKPSTISFRLV